MSQICSNGGNDHCHIRDISDYLYIAVMGLLKERSFNHVYNQTNSNIMHLAWCTDTCHYYDMYQPRQILFDPIMTMSMRIIHETEKVQKANQRTSITWSKANINQITSTSKWTQDFGGHLEMIPIQEFYESYDAKLHNLWRYKFTNVFNLSKATPCSLGHPQGGQVSSSKSAVITLHQNAHRIWCLPTENEPLACLYIEWTKPARNCHDHKCYVKIADCKDWSLSRGCNMQSTDNHW